MPILAVSAAALTAGAAFVAENRYLDQAALLGRCNAIVSAHGDRSRRDTIGSSRAGEDIPLLVLADPIADAGTRPALLIVAGLDGTHLVGTEAAMRVAEHLLESHAELLRTSTVFVVPRANPDAAARTLGGLPQVATLRAQDDDRDGVADEDGPEDLDGDGLVLAMRQLDPAPPARPTHVADPDEPRLLRAPDAAKAERARYRVLVEGIDNDGDGFFNEDGVGGVELDRNFPHEWPEHETGAGPFQMSEPESAALASFVMAHPQIVAAIVYGPHDNLVNLPDARGRDATGRLPAEIDSADLPAHTELARLYKELTQHERAARRSGAGSFHAWLYAQRGVPTFASSVWGRPDASAPEGAASPAPEEPAETAGDGASEGAEPAAPPAEEERPRPRRRGRGGPGAGGAGGGGGPPGRGAERTPRTSGDDAGWLAWSDRDRDGAGFVPWKPFDHPQLGPVEIGGFVPGFRENPPAELLDELGAAQAAFAAAVLERLPRLSIAAPVVEELGDGVYRVHVQLRNDGFLPVPAALARDNRAARPAVVRLSAPLDRIVSGRRVERVWGVPGGGDVVQSWVVIGQPGERLEAVVAHPALGETMVPIVLEPSPQAKEVRP